MNIKLEHLKVFIAVAESGKLSDASVKMGRTPSAISMTLQQIEDQLGAPLFEGERKSRLTKLGQFVLSRAYRTVNEHENTLNDIRRFARGEQGTVRVAAVPSAATRLLPPAVEQLRKTSASVQIEIRDTDSATVLEAVRSGVVDFGIASHQDTTTDVEATLLLADPFRLVCPANHPLSQSARPIRWKDIDPHEFIANGLCDQIPSPDLKAITAQSTLTVHNTTSLIQFVSSGFGMTLLPALAAPQSPEFAVLKLEDKFAIRQLFFVSKPEETLSPSASLLAANVRDVIRK